MKMMCVKTVEVQGHVAFREGNVYEFKKTKHMGVAAYEVASESGYGVVSKDDPTMKSFVKKSDYGKSVELYKKLNKNEHKTVQEYADNLYEEIKTKTIQEEAEEYLDKLISHSNSKYSETEFCFHINKEKGIVTCFPRSKSGKNKYRSLTRFALCHPKDEFNETIGKIISLSRVVSESIPSKFLDVRGY